MSTTLLQLKRKVAQDDGLGYATGIPSTTGTTLVLYDTSADSPLDTGDDEALYAGAWLMIEADSAETPLNVGEVRRILSDGGYVPSSQRLTVSSAFTNAITTTMTYGIYLGCPPARVGLNRGLTEYINDALRTLYYKDRVLLTLVTDGDQETSGTTNWTASNSTLSKVTAAANVRLGKQALRVVNSLASGYARSALVNVTEQATYHVRADVRVASGTATLQLYDETNGAEIESVSGAQSQWRYLYCSGTIPTDCKQVSVRLVGTEASADIYWDNVSLRNSAARSIALPTWVEGETAVEEVFEVGGGSGNSTDDDHAVDEDEWPVLPWFEVTDDPVGQTPYRLHYDALLSSDALMVARVLRRCSELSADTDTTDANADLVTAATLTRIYQRREDRKAEYARCLSDLHRLSVFQPRSSKRMMVRPY